MTYDVAIVGLGAMGSATIHHLAKRDVNVIGIDAFPRYHSLGSSVGLTRIIRLAYFEHPDYVPLLVRAWQLWRELEHESGMELLAQTGGLYIGVPDGAVFAGAVRSAKKHGLPHRVLTRDDLAKLHPAFALQEDQQALFEEQAGMLFPERCIDAHLTSAERNGATLRFGERVLDIRPAGGGVTVTTTDGAISAGTAVVAVGAWIDRFVDRVLLPVQVERNVLVWLQPPQDPGITGLDRLPVFIMETTFDGSFYGFPYDQTHGLKVARHHSGETTDPDRLDRAQRESDVARVRAFLARHLPSANGAVRSSKVCMYTNTPDEHFAIGSLPRHDGVVYASACSGHGFKFSSVIGEVMADLAMTGRTAHPIDFLAADRFVSGAAAAS
jgi:sarcosine oxidase